MFISRTNRNKKQDPSKDGQRIDPVPDLDSARLIELVLNTQDSSDINSPPLSLLIDFALRRLVSDKGTNPQGLPSALRKFAIGSYRKEKIPEQIIDKELKKLPPHIWIKEIFDRFNQEETPKEIAKHIRNGEIIDWLERIPNSYKKSQINLLFCTIHSRELQEHGDYPLLIKVCGKILEDLKTEQNPGKNTPVQPKKQSGSNQTNKSGKTQRISSILGRKDEEINKLKTDLSDQEKEFKEQIEKLNGRIEPIKTQLDEEKEKVCKSHSDLKDEERLNGKLRGEKRALSSDKKKLENNIKKLKREKESTENTQKETEEQLKTLSVQFDELEAAPNDEHQVNVFLNKTITEIELRKETSQGGTSRQHNKHLREMKKLQDMFLKLYPELQKEKKITRKSYTGTGKVSVSYKALGGGDCIGASSYLIKVGKSSVLVDAGIKMGEPVFDMGPDLSAYEKLDPPFHDVIITHAHADHAGWIPVLYRKWPALTFYSTKATKELLGVMLEDSFKNMEREYKKEEDKLENDLWRPDDGLPEKPYEEEDYKEVLKKIKTLEFGQTETVGPELEFKLMRAGHILGAASVLIEGGGRKIVVTGDYSDFPQKTVHPKDWYEAIKDDDPVDLVITESTYGKPRTQTRKQLVDNFLADIESVVKKGGTALIPVFALGRAQEVLQIISQAFSDGRLKEFKVFFDGLISKINPIYEKYGEPDFKIDSKNFIDVREAGYESQDVVRECLKEPGAIITTSGMMTGGPVITYARLLLEDRRNRLFLCGYQDEDSPGKKILKMTEPDKKNRKLELFDDIEGKPFSIHIAAPAELYSLSAHSDQEQMVKAISELKPEHVVLAHGEDENREKLAKALKRVDIKTSLDIDFSLKEE